MIFQYTWPQVILHEKTATRRIVSADEVAIRAMNNKIVAVKKKGRVKWRIGATYAVQPGRGQTQVARIRLVRITRQQLNKISNREAQAEGFAGRREFLRTWRLIHGPESDRVPVWVLEFEVCEIKPEAEKLVWSTVANPIQSPVPSEGLTNAH